MRNAFIDFSQMTVSIVAVMTDVVRSGLPGIGLEDKAPLYALMKELASQWV